MARFLATYDLQNTNPSPYADYLTAAESLGWSTWIQSSEDYWYRLPNTTLIGSFDTMTSAIEAFHAIRPAAQKLLGRSLKVEKYIVVQYSSGKFHSDENTNDE